LLIITDTRERLNNIKRLIAVIDRPVQQVMIEARIVEASDDFSRDLGIRWGGTFSDVTNKRFPNTINVGPAGANPMVVDLPAAAGPGSGGAIGLQLGSFTGNLNLALELSAAEADGKAKVISSPRVITSNLKKAVISQGTDIPFVSSSANTGTNVQFQQAQLMLEVTPQVTADKKILMKVLVTKDSPQAASVGGNPLIATKKIETEIAVDDGATVVIGGIYTKDKGTTEAGVPGLKSIPLLGWLFKKKQITDRRTELLIFLTPNILDRKNEAAKVSWRE
ncbi:MAG: type IV pilus secretin PilQ, partial [Mariprofundaceae bacterium]